MPGTTTRLGIQYPIGADNVSAFPAMAVQAAGINDNAAVYLSGTLASPPAAGSVAAGTFYDATDTGTFAKSTGSAWVVYSPALRSVVPAGNYTASSGDVIDAAPGSTITLPAPAAGAMVSIYGNGAVSGGSPVTVSGGSANIFGVGMGGGPTSFLLGVPLASAILVGFGSFWALVAGQQDTGWQSLGLVNGWSAGTGFTPAARLIGDRVWLRGALNGGGATSIVVTTLGAAFRPAAPTGGAAYGLSWAVTTGGILTVTALSNTYLDDVSYLLS